MAEVAPNRDATEALTCGVDPEVVCGGAEIYGMGDPARVASPLASPARAESLAGLPDALVLSMECDPTRDEAEDYGRALSAAGVPTTVRRFAGLIHGRLNMSAFVPRSGELYDEIAAFLAPRLRGDEAAGKPGPPVAYGTSSPRGG